MPADAKGGNRMTGRPHSIDVVLPIAYAEALERVADALQSEGFGILTRIDVHDIFRQKLGAAFRPYAILGACNPALAFRALSARPDAGLLLPCAVTVEATPDGGSHVRVADPEAMLRVGDFADDAALAGVADEARERLARVARALAG
jgi:uncharacterized protein (DUF302 family)